MTTDTTTTNLTDQEWREGSGPAETIRYYFTRDESAVWSDVMIAAHRLGMLRSVPASDELPVAAASGTDERGFWLAIDDTDSRVLRAMIEAALTVAASHEATYRAEAMSDDDDATVVLLRNI